MKRAKYGGKGQDTVPVGFLDPSNSQVLAPAGTTTAYAADTVVLVTPTAGACWIATGTSPTAVADTDGSHYIEFAQDFGISSGNKINSTGAICITPYV